MAVLTKERGIYGIKNPQGKQFKGFKWSNNLSRLTTDSIYTAYKYRELADTLCKSDFIEIEKRYQESFQPFYNGLIDFYETEDPLRGYQKHGVEFILNRKSTVLADEPGLGKSAQAITASELSGYRKVLIVCPASLKENWAAQIRKWAMLENRENFNVIYGKKAKFSTKYKYYIVNYELLIYKEIQDQVMEVSPDMVIADEFHYLQNIEASRTLAFYNKRTTLSNCKKLVCVSGTPITNRPKEFYPFLRLIVPEVIDNMDMFNYGRKFCAGYKGRFGWNFNGASNTEELNLRLRSSVMLRRLKKDVLEELPPKSIHLVSISQNNKIKKILKDNTEFFEKEIKELKTNNQMSAPISQVSEIRRGLSQAKMKECLEVMYETLQNEEKILVFAHHTETIESLKDGFKKYKPTVISGKVPVKKRQKIADDFQNKNDNRVLIGNIQAAGTGFTLTRARTVFFVETSWTPGELLQAIDRVHRIGQKEKVMAYILVVQDSYEHKMLEIILKKEKNLSKVLGVKTYPSWRDLL